MNSWDKSDSAPAVDCGKCGKIERDGICTAENRDCRGFDCYYLGPNDLALMRKLAGAGSDHGKFLRMITVTVDITAPLYWYKELDTYKVGTVANSCSTMHKIHTKAFELEDFSCEHLFTRMGESYESMDLLVDIIDKLEANRKLYLAETDPYEAKRYWWQMIQLLPSSYNQRRTVQLNYQVLKNMYHARKNHKLDEWRSFCQWIETLPYAELITEGVTDERKTD
jgi:hypothetical protein